MTQEASREHPVGPSGGGRDQFIDSLMDTELYSIGAFFCDEHPDLVDEVVERSVEIERRGLEAYARAGDSGLEEGSRPCSRVSRSAITRRLRASAPSGTKLGAVTAVSPWIPRVLLVVGVIALASAIVSLSVGEGGPEPAKVGGVNDVQRIFGGIEQEGAYIGPSDAATTITVFNDIQCSDCADYEIDTIDPLVEDYARTGEARLEFRHFSLAPNDTTLAAIASEAAGMQDRQWQYIDLFFRNQDEAPGGHRLRRVPRGRRQRDPGLRPRCLEGRRATRPRSPTGWRPTRRSPPSCGLRVEGPSVVVSGPGGTEVLQDSPSTQDDRRRRVGRRRLIQAPLAE